MDTGKHILVVEDDETLCEALRFNLEAEGYAVTAVYSAEQALALDLAVFDLVLLDIMMGDISGLQFGSILKSNPSTRHIPFIFCTARDSEDDMIEGLDLGADDYITKPYSIRTMLARIRSVLRRAASLAPSAAAPVPDMLSHGGLVVMPSKKSCFVDGREVQMPRKEFEILCKLLSRPGYVFSRDELLKEIWPDEVVVVDRVIDVNITRIRQKTGEYGRLIKTRSGYGYGFFPE